MSIYVLNKRNDIKCTTLHSINTIVIRIIISTYNAMFPIDENTSNYLDKLHREFFSKKYNADKGLSLITWDKVCMQKTQ